MFSRPCAEARGGMTSNGAATDPLIGGAGGNLRDRAGAKHKRSSPTETPPYVRWRPISPFNVTSSQRRSDAKPTGHIARPTMIGSHDLACLENVAAQKSSFTGRDCARPNRSSRALLSGGYRKALQ